MLFGICRVLHCPLSHMQQEVMQAMLPYLMRRSELISAELIAFMTESQLVELVSDDDLRISTELRVLEMLEMSVEAHGPVSAEGYKVGGND